MLDQTRGSLSFNDANTTITEAMSLLRNVIEAGTSMQSDRIIAFMETMLETRYQSSGNTSASAPESLGEDDVEMGREQQIPAESTFGNTTNDDSFMIEPEPSTFSDFAPDIQTGYQNKADRRKGKPSRSSTRPDGSASAKSKDEKWKQSRNSIALQKAAMQDFNRKVERVLRRNNGRDILKDMKEGTKHITNKYLGDRDMQVGARRWYTMSGKNLSLPWLYVRLRLAGMPGDTAKDYKTLKTLLGLSLPGHSSNSKRFIEKYKSDINMWFAEVRILDNKLISTRKTNIDDGTEDEMTEEEEEAYEMDSGTEDSDSSGAQSEDHEPNSGSGEEEEELWDESEND